jgi:ParB-like chromosome segregation protein Spo0J
MAKRTAKVDMTKIDRKKLMEVLRSRVSQLIDINEVVPNPYNINKMGGQYFAALKANMADPDIGFTIPLLVRPNPAQIENPDAPKWMIVDGEHRWKAASELGYEQVPAVNVGSMPEAIAKYMMVESNQVRGSTDDAALKNLVMELEKEFEAMERDTALWDNLVLAPPDEDTDKYKVDEDDLETEIESKHPVSLYLSSEQIGVWRRITGQLRLAHGFSIEEAVMTMVRHFEVTTGFGDKTGDEILDEKQSDLVA